MRSKYPGGNDKFFACVWFAGAVAVGGVLCYIGARIDAEAWRTKGASLDNFDDLSARENRIGATSIPSIAGDPRQRGDLQTARDKLRAGWN